MENNAGPPPTGNHAFGTGPQTGAAIRMAAVSAAVWAVAGVRGRPHWTGAGPRVEKEVQGDERISRHQIPDSEDEDLESGRQRDELALAGQQWAEEGNNPLEQFVHKLPGMFRTVLQARMQWEEEQNLLFPIQTRKVPREEYPWYQLQPLRPRAQRTSLPAMGALSRNWQWGTDFLPAMVAWLQDLEWLPADDTLLQGHGYVSFMELALDFETHAGRPLPPTPQSRFIGTELSLQEKGRVMRLAVTLMGKAAGWLSAAHNHRQCATCAAVGRGVWHCCARRHTGHPPLPIPPGAPGRARAAGLRTPRGGGGGLN